MPLPYHLYSDLYWVTGLEAVALTLRIFFFFFFAWKPKKEKENLFACYLKKMCDSHLLICDSWSVVVCSLPYSELNAQFSMCFPLADYMPVVAQLKVPSTCGRSFVEFPGRKSWAGPAFCT